MAEKKRLTREEMRQITRKFFEEHQDEFLAGAREVIARAVKDGTLDRNYRKACEREGKLL